MTRGSWVFAAALVVFGTGIGLFAFRPTPSAAQPAAGGSAGGPKYTVVETEGTNLLVVDNSTNTMFYYTVEPGQEVGAPLHLRGSIDLNQVGKATLTPSSAKKGGKGAAP